ncbi:MAG: ABC transporter permease, partial [Panacagrimonas sp.]
MRNPYELFAGLRYTRAKRRNHFISFISGASMIGIAIGVTALITVLSVMNGFEKELRERILGMASHSTISAYRGSLDGWRTVAEAARVNAEVEAVAPYIEGEGMLRVGQDLSGTLLRGVLPEQETAVSDIGQHIKTGTLESLKAGEYNIVLGWELAQALGVTPGDKLDLMIPTANITPAGILPRFRRFTVSGVFRVGMYEFDRGLVLIHLADAQALYRMGEGVTGVRLKLHDMFKAPTVSRQLAETLDGVYYVNDWTRSHANFFRAVATEKIVMFIILSLI